MRTVLVHLSIPPFLHFLILGGLLVLFAGCRNCDLVEAELRTKENELREMRAELGRATCQNEALLRELTLTRQGTAVSPELGSPMYALRQITLGRGTGGIDNDDCPGDEALQVVVEPRDADGHTIKVPGSLHVEALQISPEGLKIPLSAWDIAPDQLRRSWHSGLFSTGYSLVLPWQNWPANEKVRVIARFSSTDGRMYEADKDVTIRLTPAAYRTSVLPATPETQDVLPAPRKEEPQPTRSESRWSAPEDGSATIVPANLWRAKPTPSLADAIQLARPLPLAIQPGEAPEP